MKKLLIYTISVLVSGLIGYKVGYSISETKYRNLADREVESVKKMLTERYNVKKDIKNVNKNLSNDSNNKPIDNEKGIKIRPQKEAVDYGKRYRTDTEQERIPGTPSDTIKYLKKEEVDTTKPYIITQEEFNDSEYDCVTLFYCADKVLTDDDFNQITNIGIVGGYPILNEFGKYDYDCLYVRDNKKATDYEILLEEREFKKIRPLGIIEED